MTKLGPKQLLMITYFLTKNEWTTTRELKDFFKDKISNKTITTTLKMNKLYKENSLIIFDVSLDKRGKIYKIKDDFDTFLILAQNYLKSGYALIFFESEYAQQFIKKQDIMAHIEKNLKIEYTKEARFKIHQIIKNSPTALYFGLFSKNTLSQQFEKENIQVDDERQEDSERELIENFTFGLLNDLKQQDYYLDSKVKELTVTIQFHWKIKGRKPTDIEIELPYF